MIKSIHRILPSSYRSRALVVVATIFVRAMLNFVGVAMLVPVLMLIFNEGDNSWVQEYLGVDGEVNMAAIVCGVSLAVIIAKNLILLALHRFERSFIFSLYKYLSHQLYVGYYRRGLGFIKRHNSSLLTRNVNHTSLMFATGVLRPIMAIMGELLLLLLIGVALAIYSPSVTLLAAAIFLPIVVLYYLSVRRKLGEIGERENEAQRRKSRIVNETYRGYVDIEIGGAISQIIREFNEATDSVVTLRERHSTLAQLPQMFIEIGLTVGLVVVAVLSAVGGQDGGLVFGVFAIAAMRLIPSVRNILIQWSLIRYNRHTISTLIEADISDDASEIDDCDERLELKQVLELRGVTFRFDDAEQPTISNLSLEIRIGEHVGISGASGIGKTTLFNLILGLYRPSVGGIYIDGNELTADNIHKWQNGVGYVSQNIFIREGSLASNIAFGVSEDKIDYERVNKVVKLANIDDFIDSLPSGVDTLVGEQGSRLSGGQRQRIGIARALYKRCDILLFDEATSSLDTKAEKEINEAIATLKKQNPSLTIVIIAHRDSSLKYCDRIITLE